MRVAADQADAALLALWEHTGAGCAERAVAGAVEIEAWLPPARAGRGAGVRDALVGAGVAVADVRVEREPEGWLAGQRRFHRPFSVAGRLRVRPPWEPADGGLLDVVIDPGMAFGTGQHATTRGCLELLCETAPQGALLDVGCGSGILAIAARRLGFDPVRAVDHDPDSVAAALHNARANGVGMAVAALDLDGGRIPPADIVVANLTATLLGRLARALAPAPPVRAIISGVRPAEAGDACDAFASLGLREVRSVERDGWVAAMLQMG